MDRIVYLFDSPFPYKQNTNNYKSTIYKFGTYLVEIGRMKNENN